MKSAVLHLNTLARLASVAARGSRLCILVFATLALVACGPAGRDASSSEPGDPSAHEYSFIRTPSDLIRLQTRTGQVWRVPISGDGGWRPIGGPPSDSGKPSYKGRYRVQFLSGGKQPMRRRPAMLARFDRGTGRAWVVAIEADDAWLEVADDGSPLDMAQTPAQTSTPTTTSDTAATQGEDLNLPSPADQPPVDLTPAQAAADLEAFADAIDTNHLPSEIRVWSVEQLGRYDKQQAGPILLRALDDSDPKVVIAAIHSTHRISYAAGIPKILQLQNHSDPGVRAAAKSTVAEVR